MKKHVLVNVICVYVVVITLLLFHVFVNHVMHILCNHSLIVIIVSISITPGAMNGKSMGLVQLCSPVWLQSTISFPQF